MKQASLSAGRVLLEDVPDPIAANGRVLIKVRASCISVGTELSAVRTSGESLMTKVKNKPAMISKAVGLVREKGLGAVLKKIESTGGTVAPLGYSISGVVIDVGPGVSRFAVGDYVAGAGAGFANHAEIVSIPENLVVAKPEALTFADASTVALGAIAMHGVRRCRLQIGEVCVVVGVGMLGMLAIQILRASGVRVVAVDTSDARRAVALTLGAEMVADPHNAAAVVADISGGRGGDAVLFAAATPHSEPLREAFGLCRRKGRVVMLGVSGMDLRREDLYSKELDLQMATSYGPGRYDPTYEEEGRDYPFAYVRWTENRNLSEYLRLVSVGQVSLDPLLSTRFSIDRISEAFESLNASSKPFTIVLEYPDTRSTPSGAKHWTVNVGQARTKEKKGKVGIAVIGLGAFASSIHLPNIAALDDQIALVGVLDNDAHRAKSMARQYGASLATTSVDELLATPGLDAVIIATRHDSHAALTLKVLSAGISAFVEKPLAVNQYELSLIEKFYAENSLHEKPLLMVGYNRRFSPLVAKLTSLLVARHAPAVLHYRMNAGYLPGDHWLHSDGGRIIGEACHAIDLISHLIGGQLVDLTHRQLSPMGSRYRTDDNIASILKYSDGSLGSLEYFSTGSRSCSKEAIEVHFDGHSILLDDFKALHIHGESSSIIKLPSQQKGHLEELRAFSQAVRNPQLGWPISLESLLSTSRASIHLSSVPSELRYAP